ncbi:hypothetical protein RIF29_14212 [Crotalaria pallida]|uniref:Uncharacterized protein n=1 Tax=Crotalaria pallida TaxID=3830 RepID=A0AAN9FBB7_CROPI
MPKKAEALLKNLDLLREKIKGKTIQEISSPGNKDSNARSEEQPLIKDKKDEDEAAVEKIVEETNSSVIKISSPNSRETKVVETGDEKGADKEDDMSPGVVSIKPQDDGGTVGIGLANTEMNAEQPWIIVRTINCTSGSAIGLIGLDLEQIRRLGRSCTLPSMLQQLIILGVKEIVGSLASHILHRNKCID